MVSWVFDEDDRRAERSEWEVREEVHRRRVHALHAVTRVRLRCAVHAREKERGREREKKSGAPRHWNPYFTCGRMCVHHIRWSVLTWRRRAKNQSSTMTSHHHYHLHLLMFTTTMHSCAHVCVCPYGVQLPLMSLRGDKKSTAGLMTDGLLHEKAITNTNALFRRAVTPHASSSSSAMLAISPMTVPSYSPTQPSTAPAASSRAYSAFSVRKDLSSRGTVDSGIGGGCNNNIYYMMRKHGSRRSREADEELRALPLSVYSKGKYKWNPANVSPAKGGRSSMRGGDDTPDSNGPSPAISGADDEERRRRMRITKGRNSIRLLAKNATSIIKEFERSQEKRRTQMGSLKFQLGGRVSIDGSLLSPDEADDDMDGKDSRRGSIASLYRARSRRSSSLLFGIEEEGISNEDLSGSTPASRSRVKRLSISQTTLQDGLKSLSESEERESRRRQRRSSSLVSALPDELMQAAVENQRRIEEERRMSISKLIMEEEEMFRRRSSISLAALRSTGSVAPTEESSSPKPMLGVAENDEGDDDDDDEEDDEDDAVTRNDGSLKRTLSIRLMKARQQHSDPMPVSPTSESKGALGRFIDKSKRKMSILDQALNAGMIKAISAAASASNSEAQDHEEHRHVGDFRYSAASHCGGEMGRRKMYNQDSYYFKSVSASETKGAGAGSDWGGGVEMFSVSVADGHGPDGQSVARTVAKSLVEASLESKLRLDASMNSIDLMRLVFSRVAQSVKSLKTADISMSGSTAVLALFHSASSSSGAAHQMYMTLAWVGDSRAVLGFYDSSADEYASALLTRDHKPEDTEEKRRILSNEGRIDRFIDEATGEQVGPYRVFQKYAWVPGLAMSRAFGNSIASEVGVISEPDVLSHPLQPEDAFVIIGTDGFWDFVTQSHAVSICSKAKSAPSATNELISYVKQQRKVLGDDTIVDDTTVLVIFFPTHTARISTY